MALRDRAVRKVEHAQMRTIPDVPKVPACPVIHVNRRYKIIPRMFCRQGKKTPLKVPSFCVSVESVTETGVGGRGEAGRRCEAETVSYTHLTLPTICSV